MKNVGRFEERILDGERGLHDGQPHLPVLEKRKDARVVAKILTVGVRQKIAGLDLAHLPVDGLSHASCMPGADALMLFEKPFEARGLFAKLLDLAVERDDNVRCRHALHAAHFLHREAVVFQAHAFDDAGRLRKLIVAAAAFALPHVNEAGAFVVLQKVRRDAEMLREVADEVALEWTLVVVGHSFRVPFRLQRLLDDKAVALRRQAGKALFDAVSLHDSAEFSKCGQLPKANALFKSSFSRRSKTRRPCPRTRRDSRVRQTAVKFPALWIPLAG